MRYPPDQRWAWVKPEYRYFECYMHDDEPVQDQHGNLFRVVSHEYVDGRVKPGLRPQKPKTEGIAA